MDVDIIRGLVEKKSNLSMKETTVTPEFNLSNGCMLSKHNDWWLVLAVWSVLGGKKSNAGL